MAKPMSRDAWGGGSGVMTMAFSFLFPPGKTIVIGIRKSGPAGPCRKPCSSCATSTTSVSIHDREGAGGAGHSAWVAKKSNGKYQAIDFNPQGQGIRNQEFNSLEEAINYLNQDNNRYESYLEFPATPQHGSDFVDKINEYISDGYSLGDNNCYTTGANAYNETNPDPYGIMLHTGNTPNCSYARNKQNGGIQHVIE